MLAVLTALAMLLCLGCGMPVVPPRGPVVTGIRLAPSEATIRVGDTQQFTVLFETDDGSLVVPTQDQVIFRSSLHAVATVDGHGIVTGIGPGTAQIQVFFTAMPSIWAFSRLEVIGTGDPLSFTLTPTQASMGIGDVQQFTLISRRGNGMTIDVTGSASWRSTRPEVASVNERGAVTALREGTTNIIASVGGAGGTSLDTMATVEVGPARAIALETSTRYLRLYATERSDPNQIRLTAVMADGTRVDRTEAASWTSSDPLIASVSNDIGRRGSVQAGRTPGSVTITATYQSLTATLVVEVVPSQVVRTITINPPTASMAVGMAHSFTAQATFADGGTRDVTSLATWSASDPRFVVALDRPGVFRGVACGMATITASLDSVTGMAGATVNGCHLVGIEFDPAVIAIPRGATARLEPLGVFWDMTRRPLTTGVNFSTTNPAVATVSRDGVLTAVAEGTTMARAEVGSFRGTLTVFVVAPAVTNITLEPANPTIAVGASVQFEPIATLSDGSTRRFLVSPRWTSSDDTIATVTDMGLVRCERAGGPVVITVTSDAQTGTSNVMCVAE